MPLSVTINEVNSPRCTLCRGQDDYGVTLTYHWKRDGADGQKLITTEGTVTLCQGCLEEAGRVWIDELVREGHAPTLATIVDQLILKLHRNN